MDMHPAQLRAAMEHGKHFSRIEELLVVEGGFHRNLLGEIDGVEHFWHQITFLDADAMFACQHAADCNTQAQNIRAKRFGAGKFAGIVRIVENERVQIAVPRVEDIRDVQTMALR